MELKPKFHKHHKHHHNHNRNHCNLQAELEESHGGADEIPLVKSRYQRCETEEEDEREMKKSEEVGKPRNEHRANVAKSRWINPKLKRNQTRAGLASLVLVHPIDVRTHTRLHISFQDAAREENACEFGRLGGQSDEAGSGLQLERREEMSQEHTEKKVEGGKRQKKKKTEHQPQPSTGSEGERARKVVFRLVHSKSRVVRQLSLPGVLFQDHRYHQGPYQGMQDGEWVSAGSPLGRTNMRKTRPWTSTTLRCSFDRCRAGVKRVLDLPFSFNNNQ